MRIVTYLIEYLGEFEFIFKTITMGDKKKGAGKKKMFFTNLLVTF
jgi:hypothetical protein